MTKGEVREVVLSTVCNHLFTSILFAVHKSDLHGWYKTDDSYFYPAHISNTVQQVSLMIIHET